MMTFNTDFNELEAEHIYELAKLLHELSISFISLSGPEMVSLFPSLGYTPRDIHEAQLNITGTYIQFQVDGASKYISPELLLSQPVEKDLWFEYSATASILNYLHDRLGSQELLNKIQMILDSKFEYLSTGQARSVIKRYLGFSLSSVERNDIYRLRKKIEGYKQLVNAFEGKLSINRRRVDSYADQKPFLTLPDHETFVSTNLSKLAFLCWECRSYQPFPEGGIIDVPYHHDKPMSISWNVVGPVKDRGEGFKELQHVLQDPKKGLKSIHISPKSPKPLPEGFPKLYCTHCKMYQDIDEELKEQLENTEHRISLPTHHGEAMQILTEPREELDRIVGIMQNYVKDPANMKSGSYYLCTSCELMIRFDPHAAETSDTPTHHGEMMQVVNFGSNSPK